MVTEENKAGKTEKAEPSQANAEEQELFQIEEAAKKTGLTTRTLRYYEEKGLLVPTRHGDSNYRLYTQIDIERLERIKQLRDLLSFSLDEIRELMENEDLRHNAGKAYRAATTNTEKQQQILESQRLTERELSLIEEKLQSLQKLRGDAQVRLERYRNLLTQLESEEKQ